MSKVNWRRVVFVGALWWLVYAAPTEDSLIAILNGNSSTSLSDDF
jgi:hypothetical protein